MRPTRWTDLFALFFDPRVPIAFVIGSLALAVAGSAAYALLVDLLGTTRWVQLSLLIGTLLIVLFAVLTLQQAIQFWSRRPAEKLNVPTDQQVAAHGGLVLPVGLRTDGPERPILLWHLRDQQLRHCWLLVSEQVRASVKFGDLRQWLLEQNVEVHSIQVADPHAVASSYTATMEALNAARVLRGAWPPVVDITGGTAMMSVGIALAAREQGVAIQYYPSHYDAKGRVMLGSATAPLVAAFILPQEQAP